MRREAAARLRIPVDAATAGAFGAVDSAELAGIPGPTKSSRTSNSRSDKPVRGRETPRAGALAKTQRDGHGASRNRTAETSGGT